MTIKTFLVSLFVSCLFFVALAFAGPEVLAAPRLYFDPSSATSNRDADFQIKIQIDVESQSVFGADAVVTFPSADITVKSVTNGDFFPSNGFSSAQSSGKIEIHGFFPGLYDSKSGGGTFVILTLNSNKDTGSGIFSFTCSGSGNDTQILNLQGTNILSCSSLNLLTVSYSSPTTGGTTGEPNSCGGTCGSNYNCKAGLFCYQSF